MRAALSKDLKGKVESNEILKRNGKFEKWPKLQDLVTAMANRRTVPDLLFLAEVQQKPN